MSPNRARVDSFIAKWRFSPESETLPDKSQKSSWRAILSLWMKFAHLLGKLNAYVFLTLFYWILIGPAAVVLRLLGKDLLVRSPKKKQSYWIDKEQEPQTLERSKQQF